MLATSEPILSIVLRVLVVYSVVLIGFRLTGKRELAQVTPFDLVLLLLIANAVQNSMTGPDTSLTGGIVAALTLLLLNSMVARFTASRTTLRTAIEGHPTLLVHNGRVVAANLEKEKISAEDLDRAIREHGVPSIEEVALAVMEIDGSISVIRNDELPAGRRDHHRFRMRNGVK